MNSLASSLKKPFHSTIHCFLGKDVLLCIIKLGRKKKLEVNEEELSQVGFFYGGTCLLGFKYFLEKHQKGVSYLIHIKISIW